MMDDLVFQPAPPVDPDPPEVSSEPIQGTTENEGKVLGGAPSQTIQDGPPTHIIWHENGDHSIVYPEGHDPADLTPLPEGTDLAFIKVDASTRTISLDAEAANAFLHAKIDEEVGALRRQFVTDITGQEAAYTRKFAEADSFLKNGEGPFPMLTVEAGKKGMEVVDLATQVVGIGNFWTTLDNAVEAERCGAKWAIEQATTYEDKVVAATVDWNAVIAPILAAQN